LECAEVTMTKGPQAADGAAAKKARKKCPVGVGSATVPMPAAASSTSTPDRYNSRCLVLRCKTIRYGEVYIRTAAALIHVVEPFGLVGRRTSREEASVAMTGNVTGEPCHLAAIGGAATPPGVDSAAVVFDSEATSPTG
jgi:hypothetical protein